MTNIQFTILRVIETGTTFYVYRSLANIEIILDVQRNVSGLVPTHGIREVHDNIMYRRS